MSLDRYELLMAKLAEEAGEVVQSAIKCLQFGLEDVYDDETAKEKLHSELNDLYAVVNLLNVEAGLDFVPDEGWTQLKKAKIDKWAEYADHVDSLPDARQEYADSIGISPYEDQVIDLEDILQDSFDNQNPYDDLAGYLPEPDRKLYY